MTAPESSADSNLTPGPGSVTPDSEALSSSRRDPSSANGDGGGRWFRQTVLRGLGIVLPPLLTIVVLIWAWNSIDNYLLKPIESIVRGGIVWSIEDTYREIPQGAIATHSRLREGFTHEGTRYVPDPTGRRYFPEYVARTVDENADAFGPLAPPPASANSYWHRYVQLEYMPRILVVPIFLVLFTVVLVLLGRILTLSFGRALLRLFDAAILRIPLVNKVYGGVKQVTDFAFSDREIEFNNVVAVQYPREGLWSLGFVTGGSLKQLSEAAGEEMLSVLMPTSPMPMTGFTITVRRSETIDMDLTIDEAIQFIVSCGVVVPPHQRPRFAASPAESASKSLPPAITDGAAPAGSGSPVETG